MPENSETVSVSQYLQDLISSNSELGSRLLSLLLVSSGNGKEIMDAINRGDLTSIRNLDLAVDFKVPAGSQVAASQLAEQAEQASEQIAGQSAEHVKSKEDSQEFVAESPRGELASIQSNQQAEDGSYSQIDKRKRNTEASARFRVRKRQREHEKMNKLKELNIKVTQLYKRIDVLLEENQHWKQKLEELNERKSKEMLERIKRRNAGSP
ncbi:MET28 (YIR017C) [Zygosaccharomyces parabailii]|nr:MET28 (YIR017C) [Zygosaccharomyces parabailii]CDH16835.1 uncharacterized protein ZBAI_08623 [Zygosaccharomyces bailii ISA1307]